MAEHAIHQHKAYKLPDGVPESLKKNILEARRNDYEMMRLIAKNHSQTLGLALFCFGEARKACRKAVFASATVHHEPDRLINSSIWSESLFPAGIVKEIRDTAANADKSLIQKWGMHPTDFDKRKGYGDMGPPKKKPKHNFKSKDLQKGSPAFNAK